MSVEISNYGAKWNPDSEQGQIALFAKGHDRKDLSFTDAANFLAVLTMLSSSKTAVWSDDGSISTGREVVDE